jgi:hypothetical protein
MSHKVVETIWDTGKKRRIHIFCRDDGTFGFYEEHFSDEPYEHCWIPRSPATESFCDTLEAVIREVHGRVEWLRTAGPDN